MFSEYFGILKVIVLFLGINTIAGHTIEPGWFRASVATELF
jgi:hypothetical protein